MFSWEKVVAKLERNGGKNKFISQRGEGEELWVRVMSQWGIPGGSNYSPFGARGLGQETDTVTYRFSYLLVHSEKERYERVKTMIYYDFFLNSHIIFHTYKLFNSY